MLIGLHQKIKSDSDKLGIYEQRTTMIFENQGELLKC